MYSHCFCNKQHWRNLCRTFHCHLFFNCRELPVSIRPCEEYLWRGWAVSVPDMLAISEKAKCCVHIAIKKHTQFGLLWIALGFKINPRVIIQNNNVFISTHSLAIRDLFDGHKQVSFLPESAPPPPSSSSPPPLLSVEETQKGWVRDPISSGGRASGLLSFERQHGKISGHLLREPPQGQTVLLPRGPAAQGPAVCCWVSWFCLLWEDFQPCAAIKIPLCPSTLSLSLFPVVWPCVPLRPKSCSSCDKSITQIITASVPLFASPPCERGWCDPQLMRTSIHRRMRGVFLRRCVYISSLAAPWIPVRQCQGRTTS